MNRRLFFQRVFGTVAAATIGPFLPVPAHALGSFGSVPLVNGSTLAFHPDAFAMVWDLEPTVNRMDVLYGVGNTEHACRVLV